MQTASVNSGPARSGSVNVKAWLAHKVGKKNQPASAATPQRHSLPSERSHLVPALAPSEIPADTSQRVAVTDVNGRSPGFLTRTKKTLPYKKQL